jgi:hypothetical protein
MALNRKDALASGLTALVVLAFFATHEGWNVPLVGDSYRWAAVAVLLLGALTCAQGQAGDEMKTRMSDVVRLLAALGITALVLGVIAILTGSLTALSLLVADIVLLWAVSTARHARARLVTT